MAQAIEWRANTTGKSQYFHTAGWGNISCGRLSEVKDGTGRRTACWGSLEYIYSTYWKCRDCGMWHSIVPKA